MTKAITKGISIKTTSILKKNFSKIVGNGLNSYNSQKIGSFNWKDVAVQAKNDKGKLVGGLVGGTYWGWLFVKMLWVDQDHRDSGLGTELLRRAEALAWKRGCRYVHLDTFSFQAPKFYRKLGFKRFGSLRPFPRKSTRFFLFKKLSKKNK